MSQTPLFDQLILELEERGLKYEDLVIPIQVERRGMVVPQKPDQSTIETQPMAIGVFMDEAVKQLREFQGGMPDMIAVKPLHQKDGPPTQE